MEHLQAGSEVDRRSVLLFGATGAAALLGGTSFAQAAEDVKAEEIAPGVTLRALSTAEPLGPVPGLKKASLLELTFQPGASFGPDTLKTIAICEIQGAPLYVQIEGKEPFTLEPGDIYFCPVGTVETDTNKSDKPCIMRIVDLEPA